MVSEEFLRGVCDNLTEVTELLKRGDKQAALDHIEKNGGANAKRFLQYVLETKNPEEVIRGLTEMKSKVKNGIEKIDERDKEEKEKEAEQQAKEEDARIEADAAELEEARGKLKTDFKCDHLNTYIDWKAEKARIEREIKEMKAEKKRIRDEAKEIKRQMRKEKDEHRKKEYEIELKAKRAREEELKRGIKEKRKEKGSIPKDKGKSNTPVLDGNARQVSADKNMLQQQMIQRQMQQR